MIKKTGNGHDMKKFLKIPGIDYDAARFTVKAILFYGGIWLFAIVLNLTVANSLTQLLVTILTVFHGFVLPVIGYIAVIYLIKSNTAR